MVTEPVEEGLVDPTRGLPGFAVGRQVLTAMPQDGVGEGRGRSCAIRTPGLERRDRGFEIKDYLSPG